MSPITSDSLNWGSKSKKSKGMYSSKNRLGLTALGTCAPPSTHRRMELSLGHICGLRKDLTLPTWEAYREGGSGSKALGQSPLILFAIMPPAD